MRLNNAYSFIAQFDFKIVHRPGTSPEITVADALSHAVPFEVLERDANDDKFETELFQMEYLNNDTQSKQNNLSSSINLLECFAAVTEPLKLEANILFRFSEQKFTKHDFKRLYKQDNNIQMSFKN